MKLRRQSFEILLDMMKQLQLPIRKYRTYMNPGIDGTKGRIIFDNLLRDGFIEETPELVKYYVLTKTGRTLLSDLLIVEDLVLDLINKRDPPFQVVRTVGKEL